MTLIELLKMVSPDSVPLRVGKNEVGRYDIDSRPQSVFRVSICFMAEEETWITCPIESEILVPWYRCEVKAFQPAETNYTLEVWLRDIDYLMNNFKDDLVKKWEVKR